ncbi:MAG: hypothetical protein IIX10_00985, partial [Clostridia bacterium]|nr:hypothetical protein [Clostridia bacterium]
FSQEEINLLYGMSFNRRVAEVLNRFFHTKLTGWDIDFCIGRYPVRMEQLAHRIFMAELRTIDVQAEGQSDIPLRSADKALQESARRG